MLLLFNLSSLIYEQENEYVNLELLKCTLPCESSDRRFNCVCPNYSSWSTDNEEDHPVKQAIARTGSTLSVGKRSGAET